MMNRFQTLLSIPINCANTTGCDEHIRELNSYAAPDLATTPDMLGDKVYRSLRVLPLDLRQAFASRSNM